MPKTYSPPAKRAAASPARVRDRRAGLAAMTRIRCVPAPGLAVSRVNRLRAAEQRVAALAALALVALLAAVEQVVALAAEQLVPAVLALQRVPAVAADQLVGAAAAVDEVLA